MQASDEEIVAGICEKRLKEIADFLSAKVAVTPLLKLCNDMSKLKPQMEAAHVRDFIQELIRRLLAFAQVIDEGLVKSSTAALQQYRVQLQSLEAFSHEKRLVLLSDMLGNVLTYTS